MKVLIDPDWLPLVEDLSDADCRALLMAMFGYPGQECDLGIWKFIKKQLDKDAAKYNAKCERLLENRMISGLKNAKSESITDFSELKSGAIANSKEQVHNNTNQSNSNGARADAVVKNLAGAFNPNASAKFTIDNNFSLAEIIRRNPAWIEEFRQYSPEHLEAAEKSLKSKMHGERKTITQILGWVKVEGSYGKRNNE
jgi:hypothetical protein